MVIDENTRIIMAHDASLKSHFISIRGSSDINNWISNIETRIIYPYVDNNIGVHNGLYYEYLLYKERLISYVHHLNVNDSLIITGHSSGSALASFLAYDIVAERLFRYSNIHLYTFGSPRIGNKDFVKSFTSFDIKHYRITYKKDIVPHLPQELLGFVHIPHEIWFSTSSKYKLCHDIDNKEDDSCSNSCSPFYCTSVNDHLNYLGFAIGSDAC
jgi:predicted lipase